MGVWGRLKPWSSGKSSAVTMLRPWRRRSPAGARKREQQVAEGVEVLVDGDVLEGLVVGAELFGVEAVVGVDAGDGGEMAVVLGMQVQQRHDGRGLVEVEVDVVLGLDEQGCLSAAEIGGTHEESEETRGC